MDLSGDHWWDAARSRERLAAIHLDDPEFTRALERIASPRWVPDRPRPRLPSKWEIASYWAERDEWFLVDLEHPHCFACDAGGRYPADATPELRWNNARRLQRGHLVNRARDGLDQVQNLVPLCAFCNRWMPVFDVEHAEDALAWVLDGGAVGELTARLMARGQDS